MTLYYYGIDYNIGGLEIFGKNLIAYVRKHRPDVRIVILAAYPQIAFEDYFLKLGCGIMYLPSKDKSPFKYFRALVEILSKHKQEDVLQINACSYRNYLLFKAAKKAGIKTIVAGHLSSSLSFLGNIIHRICRGRFVSLGQKVAVSEATRDYMFGHKRDDVKIITNGIDFERFSFSLGKRKKMRRRLGVGDNELLIAQVGRISKQKNQLFSLDVARRYMERNPKAHCFFFGDINDKSVGNQIRLVHNERIKLCSPDAENIDAIYDASDVVLVPSTAEGGLSFVAVEAARSGCQVFMNESLGRMEGDIKNVRYLPLEEETWARELRKVELSMLEARKSQDLPEVYSLEHSMAGYLELYGGTRVS